MERIVRGLLITRQAALERDSRTIVNNYAAGFNSNMCTAIIGISQKQQLPVEYAIRWSQKIPPGDDVHTITNVELRSRHYEYLKEASDQLRQLQPEYVTITGMVVGLSSADDPLGSSGVDRSVIVNWLRPQGNPVKVRIVLNRDDYVAAHKAHLDWSTISVTGEIQRIGGNWRLSQPHDFNVLN